MLVSDQKGLRSSSTLLIKVELFPRIIMNYIKPSLPCSYFLRLALAGICTSQLAFCASEVITAVSTRIPSTHHALLFEAVACAQSLLL